MPFTFLRLLVPILLISACQVNKEIPAYLLPGAAQELVRSSLELTKCDPHKVTANFTFCEVKESRFAGAPASFKLTFQNGILIFAAITLPEKEFPSTILQMTKIMGEANSEREFDASGVKHRSVHWGNKNLFATANKYAFGDTTHSMLVLQLPEATPAIVHPLFLKKSDEKKP